MRSVGGPRHIVWNGTCMAAVTVWDQTKLPMDIVAVTGPDGSATDPNTIYRALLGTDRVSGVPNVRVPEPFTGLSETSGDSIVEDGVTIVTT